jgi:hypothetical protein
LFVDGYTQQRETGYKIETFGSFSTGEHTPFWMVYHNWGMVPLDANNAYLKGAVFHDQTINHDWSFRLGLDLAGSYPYAYKPVWIQQLYGELNWKNWRLKIGSKEDYTSQLNEQLSSGDFNLSNNARPLPELKISMTDYWLVPYTKGNFYFKGDFAVGKYLDGEWQKSMAQPTNQKYVMDCLSHHKSVYFRFGNIEDRNNMQFTVGFNHYAQWGGSIYHPKSGTMEQQPQGWDDFFRVMIAKEGGANASGTDQAYVSGSQTGSYLFKFDYKLKNTNKLSLYVQHFFDDGSGMHPLQSYPDNLIGFEFQHNKRSLLSGLVFEYVHTTQQTGPIHFNMEMNDAHAGIRQLGNGNDDYYNNFEYIQGPSHFGRTMGTPLFLSPEYNTDGRLNFKSNRIIAYHLGVEGYLSPNLAVRVLATTGQSWGRYYVPFVEVKDGFASNLDLIYTVPTIENLDIKLSAGYNTGDFFDEKAFGMGITITKQGILKKLGRQQ